MSVKTAQDWLRIIPVDGHSIPFAEALAALEARVEKLDRDSDEMFAHVHSRLDDLEPVEVGPPQPAPQEFSSEGTKGRYDRMRERAEKAEADVKHLAGEVVRRARETQDARHERDAALVEVERLKAHLREVLTRLDWEMDGFPRDKQETMRVAAAAQAELNAAPVTPPKQEGPAKPSCGAIDGSGHICRLDADHVQHDDGGVRWSAFPTTFPPPPSTEKHCGDCDWFASYCTLPSDPKQRDSEEPACAEWKPSTEKAQERCSYCAAPAGGAHAAGCRERCGGTTWREVRGLKQPCPGCPDCRKREER